jgi:stress response protein YsnF
MNGDPWNIRGRDGLRARRVGDRRIGDKTFTEVEFDGGQRAHLPQEQVRCNPDGSFTIPVGKDDLAKLRPEEPFERSGEQVIPVVREEIAVDKRAVETGRVAMHITPQLRQEVVDVALSSEQVEIQRVPVNQIVDAPTPPREHGVVTIVPVYEEVVVIQKKLVLKEEIHVRRQTTTRHERHPVELRSEEVHILRADAPMTKDPGKSA